MESPKTSHFISAAQSAPKWAAFVNKWMCYGMYDLFGGPHVLKAATVINISAILQILLFPIAMFYYQNNSVAAWVFFVMIVFHESIWLLKNAAFPDSSWENRQTIAGSIWFFLYLCAYWFMAWMLVSNFSPLAYPLMDNAWFALCLIMNFSGCILLAVSDAQKNLILKLRSGLITDGMFRYARHPNYLGSILIYTSFTMMVWNWIAAAIWGVFLVFIFIVNMIMKEASMSHHPNWAEYRKRTWWIVPGIF